MKESKLRSFAKALTWRVTASLTTVIIALIFVKDVSVALSIGGIEFFAKFFIYYAHERAWNKIP